jgi:hypothetical protein
MRLDTYGDDLSDHDIWIADSLNQTCYIYTDGEWITDSEYMQGYSWSDLASILHAYMSVYISSPVWLSSLEAMASVSPYVTVRKETQTIAGKATTVSVIEVNDPDSGKTAIMRYGVWNGITMVIESDEGVTLLAREVITDGIPAAAFQKETLEVSWLTVDQLGFAAAKRKLPLLPR